jgi:hypothetical protein
LGVREGSGNARPAVAFPVPGGEFPRATATTPEERNAMSVGKVIEITSQSEKSFEDAIEQGIRRASEKVDNIASAWIKEQKVEVDGGAISCYRVDMKVTFVVHE